MNILAFADTPYFKELDINNKPDMIFLLGDIDYPVIRQIERMYRDIAPIFGVLGNHDGPDFFEDTSIIDVHGKIAKVNGVTIAGFGGSPVYNKRKYCQYEEHEVKTFVDTLETVDFFLAHSNPVVDWYRSINTSHAGFQSFNDYIQRAQPKHFFHGHLHEHYSYQIASTQLHAVYPYKYFSF